MIYKIFLRFLFASLVALAVLTPISVYARKPTPPPTAGPLPWPFSPTNVQHQITGTLGEFRPGHLHEGVDIKPLNGNVIGAQVYSVSDGAVVNKSKPRTRPDEAFVEVRSHVSGVGYS